MKYLFLMCLALNAAAAPIEGQERGGGKQVELEFAEMGQLAVKAIADSLRRGKEEFAGFRVDAFTQAMAQTEVSARPEICDTKIDLSTGGSTTTCLDARYLPEQSKIELSEKEWRKKRCMEKVALAVHEYGRASGNENGNYRYSSRVRDSDEVRVACDGWEGDEIERCSGKLKSLQASVDGCVVNYKERMKTEPRYSNLDKFVIELENTMDAWRRWSDGECGGYAEQYCLQSCNSIAGTLCPKLCWH